MHIRRYIPIAFIVFLLIPFMIDPSAASAAPSASPYVGVAYDSAAPGLWLVRANGQVEQHLNAPYYGDPSLLDLAAPVTGIAATPDGNGYWLVARDGGVFTYGDAGFYGSLGSYHLAEPIVGIAPTMDGHGYWLLGAKGGIFAFGDASFNGSLYPDPSAAVAITTFGTGYRVASADGSVATRLRTQATLHPYPGLDAPVVGLANDPTSKDGFWLLTQSGNIYALGGAPQLGNMNEFPNHGPVLGIAATPSGRGYVVVTPTGFYAFGDAI